MVIITKLNKCFSKPATFELRDGKVLEGTDGNELRGKQVHFLVFHLFTLSYLRFHLPLPSPISLFSTVVGLAPVCFVYYASMACLSLTFRSMKGDHLIYYPDFGTLKVKGSAINNFATNNFARMSKINQNYPKQKEDMCLVTLLPYYLVKSVVFPFL